MKNLILITIIIGVVFLAVIFKNPSSKNVVQPQTSKPEIKIEKLDTSQWKHAQLHQNISVRIPSEWTFGSDGIYNYDINSVTGERDPNFPNNSVKCVFYKDTTLRTKLDLVREAGINSNPTISTLDATWNANSEGLRQTGQVVNLYVFDTGTEEIFTECNVFKGEWLSSDKNILENVLLTIETD